MRTRSRALACPVLVALVLAAALGVGVTAASAADGGMAGMPGMTEEEMQAMSQPEAPSVTTGADSHGSEEIVEGSSGVMEAESVNWFVIGGFILLVAGSTAGAMALKRNLARRMATGALAGAGALDV